MAKQAAGKEETRLREALEEIARIAAPKTLVLTHFYPPVERVDIAGEVSARYDGSVQIAHDGWSTEIGD